MIRTLTNGNNQLLIIDFSHYPLIQEGVCKKVFIILLQKNITLFFNNHYSTLIHSLPLIQPTIPQRVYKRQHTGEVFGYVLDGLCDGEKNWITGEQSAAVTLSAATRKTPTEFFIFWLLKGK